MEFALIKSVLQQDTSPVVLCDLAHTIVYMNPAACQHYARFGGSELLGKNLLDCHNEGSRQRIGQILDWFGTDLTHNSVHTYYSERENKDVYMIALRDDAGVLIGYYEKHAGRNRDMTPLYEM